MNHRYHVEVVADYYQLGQSPGQINRALVKVLRAKGFNEVNFQITVKREDEEVPLDKSPVGRGKLKVEGEKRNVATRRKAKGKGNKGKSSNRVKRHK